MKICVYTCITGNYDSLNHVSKEEGIDYLCFTNNLNLKSEEWDVKYIQNEGYDNLCLSRKHKILMNDYIKENYDVCIYIDGNLTIRESIWDFLNMQCDLENYDMTIFNHSARKCVYEEAVAIVKGRKGNPDKVRETVDYLKSQGYPHGQGLIEASILVRKTHSQKVDETMLLWFELFMKYAKRDQLVFDFALYQTNLRVKRLDYKVFDNPWFVWKKHPQKIGFEMTRIFFGDYDSIWNDNVRDIENDSLQGAEYHMIIPNDCDYMEVHLGQLESGYLSKVFVNDEMVEFDSNATVCGERRHLLGEDPLLLRINRKFRCGENVRLRLMMGTLSYLDYLDEISLIKKKVEERDRIINGCNQTINECNRVINEKESENRRLANLLNSRKRLLKRLIKLSLKNSRITH